MSKVKFVVLCLSAMCASAALGDFLCSVVTCGEVGGKCDDTTVCPAPTTCRDGKCQYSQPGDNCSILSSCSGTETYCKNKKCVAYLKEGGNCTEYECASDLKCNDNKVCQKVPRKEGDSCTDTVGCDLSKGVYCSNGKCKGLPKEGETCYLTFCKAGLKCNSKNVCEKPAKKGEKCSSTVGCDGDDLYCSVDLIGGNVCKEYPGEDESCTTLCKSGYTCTLADKSMKCKKSNPDKGDYCYPLLLPCTGKYQCKDNKCVETITCTEYDGCSGFPERICSTDGNCIESMTGEEGHTCSLDVNSIINVNVAASFQCKEGYGCVPSLNSGKCVKIETKLGDRKNCTLGVCPEDSFCSCNDKIGKNQCVPYPYADKSLRSKAKKVYELKNKYGILNEEFLSEYNELNDDINDQFYSYSYLSRCDLFAAASAVKVSFALIIAVLMFFSL